MSAPDPASGPRRKAFWGVLFCVLVWAVNYPAIKIAYREMSPLAYTGWRFVAASAVLVGWCLARSEPVVPKRDAWPLAALLALSGVGVYQVFFALGVAATSGFSAALLNSLSPLLSVGLVSLLGWERMGPRAALGSGVSYLGVALFLASAHGTADLGSASGNLLSLASASCWAVYNLASSRAAGRMSPLTAQAVTFAGGTVLVLAYSLPAMLRQDYARVSALTWTILALSSVVPLVVAFRLWSFAIQVLGVTRTSSFGFLVPVAAGVASALLTGERFTAGKLASAAVVLLGLAVTRTGGRAASPPGQPPGRFGRGEGAGGPW